MSDDYWRVQELDRFEQNHYQRQLQDDLLSQAANANNLAQNAAQAAALQQEFARAIEDESRRLQDLTARTQVQVSWDAVGGIDPSDTDYDSGYDPVAEIQNQRRIDDNLWVNAQQSEANFRDMVDAAQRVQSVVETDQSQISQIESDKVDAIGEATAIEAARRQSEDDGAFFSRISANEAVPEASFSEDTASDVRRLQTAATEAQMQIRALERAGELATDELNVARQAELRLKEELAVLETNAERMQAEAEVLRDTLLNRVVETDRIEAISGQATRAIAELDEESHALRTGAARLELDRVSDIKSLESLSVAATDRLVEARQAALDRVTREDDALLIEQSRLERARTAAEDRIERIAREDRVLRDTEEEDAAERDALDRARAERDRVQNDLERLAERQAAVDRAYRVQSERVEEAENLRVEAARLHDSAAETRRSWIETLRNTLQAESAAMDSVRGDKLRQIAALRPQHEALVTHASQLRARHDAMKQGIQACQSIVTAGQANQAALRDRIERVTSERETAQDAVGALDQFVSKTESLIDRLGGVVADFLAEPGGTSAARKRSERSQALNAAQDLNSSPFPDISTPQEIQPEAPIFEGDTVFADLDRELATLNLSDDPVIEDMLSRCREGDLGGYYELTGKGEFGRTGDKLESHEVFQNAFVRYLRGVERHDKSLKNNPAIALSTETHKRIKNLHKADLVGATAEKVLAHHLGQLAKIMREGGTVLEHARIEMIRRMAEEFVAAHGY